MKTLLFLGAAVFQLPAIRYALTKKYRVLTCDNRPENPGHRYAEKCFPVSTVDVESVLNLAKAEKVDAVLSYASDVGMPAAAYTASALGLAGVGPEAVNILTNKAKFRQFLSENRLQSAVRFEAFFRDQKAAALDFAGSLKLPFIVKPVDAAGSRGVSKVSLREEALAAMERAWTESRSGQIILESFFEKKGMQVCSNGFFQNGRVDFIWTGDGYFHEDGRCMAPWAESFPSSHDSAALVKLRAKVESILKAVGFGGPAPFNVDAMIGADGEPFIVEIAPRSGGNYMDEAIALGSGVDLAAAAVEAALGHAVDLQMTTVPSKNFYACFMIHSLKSGTLDRVEFDDSILENRVRYVPYLSPGADVHAFTQGGHAVGNAIFKFSSQEQMRETIRRMPLLCRPILRSVLDLS